MAASYTCDGCGVNVAKPKIVGHVIKRDYCEECEPKAHAYLTAEEALRAKVQQEYDAGRSGLMELHGKDGFKLPDVP